jgi:hypothetical protein
MTDRRSVSACSRRPGSRDFWLSLVAISVVFAPPGEGLRRKPLHRGAPDPQPGPQQHLDGP